MVALLKTHVINSSVERSRSKEGPMARGRRAQDTEHGVSKAVVKTGQMGTGDEVHVWGTGWPEGRHVLDTGGMPCSFCL